MRQPNYLEVSLDKPVVLRIMLMVEPAGLMQEELYTRQYALIV
jgi:hypothetical protein